jgi:hypothetical protein
MDVVEVLHCDCVGCLAQHDQEPEVPVLVVLAMMLHDGVTLEQIVGDLCLPHRQRLARISDGEWDLFSQ